MELRIAALDDVPGWSVLRRPEVSLLLRGADEITARVAAALDERRGEDVVDVVVDTLTADGFRSTPDFALATPDADPVDASVAVRAGRPALLAGRPPARVQLRCSSPRRYRRGGVNDAENRYAMNASARAFSAGPIHRPRAVAV